MVTTTKIGIIFQYPSFLAELKRKRMLNYQHPLLLLENPIRGSSDFLLVA